MASFTEKVVAALGQIAQGTSASFLGGKLAVSLKTLRSLTEVVDGEKSLTAVCLGLQQKVVQTPAENTDPAHLGKVLIGAHMAYAEPVHMSGQVEVVEAFQRVKGVAALLLPCAKLSPADTVSRMALLGQDVAWDYVASRVDSIVVALGKREKYSDVTTKLTAVCAQLKGDCDAKVLFEVANTLIAQHQAVLTIGRKDDAETKNAVKILGILKLPAALTLVGWIAAAKASKASPPPKPTPAPKPEIVVNDQVDTVTVADEEIPDDGEANTGDSAADDGDDFELNLAE